MTEFKQIIGRGTRLREDYGKLFFNILDYTGSATRQFADPSFDGFPEVEHEVPVDADGAVLEDVDASEMAEPPADESPIGGTKPEQTGERLCSVSS